MSRVCLAFIGAVGVLALAGSPALWAQEAPDTVKDPISPADCLKDKKKAPECHRLGLLYASGKDVPQDEPRALEFFDAACRGGLTGACRTQGWLLLKLHQRPEDVKRGEQLLDHGCKEGVAAACDALGRVYANGIGVAQDVPKAAKVLGNACDAGFMQSCLALADVLNAGVGIPRDAERAKALLVKACTLGTTEACEKACDWGDGKWCLVLGDQLTQAKDPDTYRIARAYQLACERGVARGCYHLARWAKKEPEHAVLWLERACTLGYAPGCGLAADHYYLGRGVIADLAAAVRLFTEACLGDFRPACITLGGIYARGERGEEEKAKGKEYFLKACGTDIACQATVANGQVPQDWGGDIEALRPDRQTVSARPVRVAGSIKEPRKIKNVNAIYPMIARAMRIQGTVTLDYVIDPSGRVTSVQVKSGPKELIQAAVDAVRQWVYTPTLLNDVPVPVIMTATVTFSTN